MPNKQATRLMGRKRLEVSQPAHPNSSRGIHLLPTPRRMTAPPSRSRRLTARRSIQAGGQHRDRRLAICSTGPGAAPRPCCVMASPAGPRGVGLRLRRQLRFVGTCNWWWAEGFRPCWAPATGCSHAPAAFRAAGSCASPADCPFGLPAYLLAAQPYRLGQPPRPARSWRRFGP